MKKKHLNQYIKTEQGSGTDSRWGWLRGRGDQVEGWWPGPDKMGYQQMTDTWTHIDIDMT